VTAVGGLDRKAAGEYRYFDHPLPDVVADLLAAGEGPGGLPYFFSGGLDS
jgi:hypothetical protein